MIAGFTPSYNWLLIKSKFDTESMATSLSIVVLIIHSFNKQLRNAELEINMNKA